MNSSHIMLQVQNDEQLNQYWTLCTCVLAVHGDATGDMEIVISGFFMQLDVMAETRKQVDERK